MNEIPGVPQVDVKALEAEVLRLRRRLAALERRVEELEGS
jgi:ubiquinone biosynthesis protein UbiJ